MLNFDLIDIWRNMNINESRYTWRQKQPFVQSRLDYFSIHNDLKLKVKKTGITSALRTDHSAIHMS